MKDSKGERERQRKSARDREREKQKFTDTCKAGPGGARSKQQVEPSTKTLRFAAQDRPEAQIAPNLTFISC